MYAYTSKETEAALCLWEAMQERLAEGCLMARALVERSGTPAARHDVIAWASQCSADWERSCELQVELMPFDWEHCPAWLAYRLAMEFPELWAQCSAPARSDDNDEGFTFHAKAIRAAQGYAGDPSMFNPPSPQQVGHLLQLCGSEAPPE